MSIVKKGYGILKKDGPGTFVRKSSKFGFQKSKAFIQRYVIAPPRRFAFHQKFGEGIDVMNRDWDYLIILDACRYDIFEQIVDIDGQLTPVISKGSHSKEFASKHFSDNNFNDTVYVTANGHGARIGENCFYDLIFTDKMDSVPDIEVLHSSKKGLAPDTVYNAGLKAYNKYPNKRIIIHFMQPHNPYFGDMSRELRKNLEKEGLIVEAREPEKLEDDTNEKDTVPGLGAAFREGYITQKELQEVYVENLEFVLEYVRDLTDELQGKIVVTADHGERLGENNKAGHPPYTYTEELRKVPWLIINNAPRPNITEEEPPEKTAIDQNAVEKRLENLGYK
jgi:hypothetical protein